MSRTRCTESFGKRLLSTPRLESRVVSAARYVSIVGTGSEREWADDCGSRYAGTWKYSWFLFGTTKYYFFFIFSSLAFPRYATLYAIDTKSRFYFFSYWSASGQKVYRARLYAYTPSICIYIEPKKSICSREHFTKCNWRSLDHNYRIMYITTTERFIREY